jgi:hypothetical protein
MEALAAKYQGSVKFFLVYGHEPHPEERHETGKYRADHKPVPQTQDPLERLALARDFRAAYRINRQVLVDGFKEGSAAWRFLGTTHYTHPVAVLDAEGKTALLTPWADAEELDQFLMELVARQSHANPPPVGG